MANYPQELAQDAVCQSHTGHMTGLWFLPSPAFKAEYEWMNVKLCLLSEKKLILCLQEESPLCHVLLFSSIMNSCLLPAHTTSTLQRVTAVTERRWRETYEILFSETANWQIKHTHTHTSLHSYGRSPVCMRRCFFIAPLDGKLLLQKSHRYGFSPVNQWETISVLGKEPWISHTQNGTRLPVCVRMCICRSVVPWNSLLQCWQLYFFFRFTCPACARKCSRRLSLRLNMRPHTCRQIQAIFWDLSPYTCVNVHLSSKLTIC